METLQDKATRLIVDVISPTARKHLSKEQVKTKLATQFIGEGKRNSSTDRYRQLYEELGQANTGKYASNDVIFVASNGRRPGGFKPVINNDLQGEFKNIDLAIKAKAKIIMDTKDHLDKTCSYNTGEIALAEYMENHGYKRINNTGLWEPK